MRKIAVLCVLFSLILAACGSFAARGSSATGGSPDPTGISSAADRPATTPAQPAPVTAVPATEAPAQPAADPTQAQSAVAGASGTTTYAIDPGQSQVAYQVNETFLNDNRFNTARGVTSGISGEITVNWDSPQDSKIGTISIDISQFTSDSGRRDNMIRNRFLESTRYPIATFVPTQIEGLPDKIEAGKTYTLKISGDLTVHQVTKPVTFDATVSATSDQLSGQAQTGLLMSDFGVGPISIAGILNTEDQVKLEFDFTAQPKASQ